MNQLQQGVGAPSAQRDNWFVRLLDHHMPETMRHAPEDQKRQMRSGIGFIWASLLMTLVFVGANFKQGNVVAAWWEVGVFFMLLTLLPMMRRTGRVVLLGNMCMFGGVSSIALSCWYTDGLEAPPLLILMLVPAWGYLGFGKGTAVAWSWISVFIAVGLFVGERMHWVPPPMGTPEKIQTKRVAEAIFTLGFGYLASSISTDIRNYAVHMLQRRTFELKQMHDRLEHLFESMTQGVLTFDSKGKIDSSVSSRAHQIFGQEELEHAHITELLFAGSDDTTGIQEGFQLFVELAFEASSNDWGELVRNAPTRVERRGPSGQRQFLNLELRPVLGESGKLERIMLLVTDDTERVTAEANAKARDAAHRREVDDLRRLMAGGAHLLLQFLEGSAHRLEEISASLPRDKPLSASGVALAFQHVHTIRGEANTFQLHELAEVCRVIEDGLSPLRTSLLRSTETAKLPEGMQDLVARAKVLLGQAKDRLVEVSPIGIAVLDQTTVSKSQLQNVASLIEKDARAGGELREAIATLAARPFGESTQRLPRAVAEWASSQKKRVEVVIEGAAQPVPPRLGAVLAGVLGHLARNAVAHGIERAERRVECGKRELALLRLSCRPIKGGVHIAVEDDGAGLSEAKLRAAAQHAGVHGDLSVSELLFVPGLSTAEDAGAIAGRGMGLSAAKEDLARVGYGIRVFTNPGAGTRFELFPQEAANDVGSAPYSWQVA